VTSICWAPLSMGPGGSTIVSERNKRALAVLKNQIKKGKRHLAIYYGVAHMPDMAAGWSGTSVFNARLLPCAGCPPGTSKCRKSKNKFKRPVTR